MLLYFEKLLPASSQELKSPSLIRLNPFYPRHRRSYFLDIKKPAKGRSVMLSKKYAW